MSLENISLIIGLSVTMIFLASIELWLVINARPSNIVGQQIQADGAMFSALGFIMGFMFLLLIIPEIQELRKNVKDVVVS